MEYLKQYRAARKLTQQDMADLLNISRVTYARYESGIREPDIATMMRIGAILGVLVDQLIGVIEPDETYSSDLYNRIRSMQSGSLDATAPTGFVGMYGNDNYFLLSKSGQEKVSQYIDDLYGNPAYMDSVGTVELRDPETGNVVMRTIAADPDEGSASAARFDAAVSAASAAGDTQKQNKA